MVNAGLVVAGILCLLLSALTIVFYVSIAALYMGSYDRYQKRNMEVLGEALNVDTRYLLVFSKKPQILSDWMYLPLPLTQKLALIDAEIPLTNVLSSAVLRLTLEDLSVMAALQRESLLAA